MTSEEKQEIINAVLAALRTNSKSIDQLTPVSEMSDNDFLELNSGRKVSYGVLFANHMSNDDAQEAWEYLDANKVDKDSRGLVEVHQAPVVYLDAMGNLDGHALNDGSDGLEYRTDTKKIYDFPGGLFGAPKAGAVYISKNNFKKFVWNGTDMVELKADECPLFVDYSEPVSFATLPVGGSYYVPSSHKIAVKIDASNTKTYDPLPDALYFFRDKGMIYTWKSSTNKWVPSGSDIKVINNLTDGGEGDALSAEMGKKLKNAILILMGSLGNYAFPGGKPDLDFDGDSTISYSVTYPSDTRVTHGNAPATVNLGDSLEVQLGTNDNLYVIDDANVVVSMGGSPVSDAYNPTTGKVTIGTVTGDIVIVATAVSYVSDGLVLHLDGKNRGGTSGQWKSLVNYNGSPITFALTNCTENSDNVQFNGTSSKGLSASTIAVKFMNGTIESLYDFSDSDYPTAYPQIVLTNNTQEGICLALAYSDNKTFLAYVNADSGGNMTQICNKYGEGSITKDKAHVSLDNSKALVNGFAISNGTSYKYAMGIDSQTTLAIGYRKRSSGENFSKGKIFFIRVYSRQLTDAERARNYKIDKQYYGLT